MEAASNKTDVSKPNPILVVTNALNAGVKGIGLLQTIIHETGGDVPRAVAIQIEAVVAYLDLMNAQSETSAEKDAYLFGINHGALMAIWRHLELLGYVVDAHAEQITLATKKEKDSKSKTIK
jgi:hypothetical protein